MLKRLILTAAALGLAVAATGAQAEPPADRAGHCFLSNQWRNWTAAPDGDTLYLRVNVNDVYRVDLTPGSRVRKYPNSFLVNRVRGGSEWVCSPLDLDLTFRDDTGMRQGLIVRSLRKLTPAEVAALPPKDRP